MVGRQLNKTAGGEFSPQASPLRKHRRRYILNMLERQPSVSVTELALKFEVSGMTIRRDLRGLEDDGLVHRVYGGALPAGRGDIPASERTIVNTDAKSLIAARAAQQIRAGSTVILDSGTTVAGVAPLLRGRDITVITGSILVADTLAADPAVRLHLLGGSVRPETLSVFGQIAEDQVAEYGADLALLGASAVSDDAFYNLFPADAPLQRAMMRAANATWLLADTTKLAARAAGRVAPITQITGLITNAPRDHPLLRKLAAQGCGIIAAPARLASVRPSRPSSARPG